MNRWFRHYAGTMRDPKFVTVAVRCKQPIERVLFVWGCILESAAERNASGEFSISADELAYFLRCDAENIDAISAGMEETGLTDNGSVAQWKIRQFESDGDPTNAERQKRYRDKRNAPVTDVTPVSNAPQSQSQSQSQSREEEGHLAAKQVSNWTQVGKKKTNGWLPPKHGAQSSKHKTIYVKQGTFEWDAYAADYRRVHNHDPTPDKNGGLWFPCNGIKPLPEPSRYRPAGKLLRSRG